jgi:DHA1 family bicyclomycin/chloramphenicol resistance-like MFS transporter
MPSSAHAMKRRNSSVTIDHHTPLDFAPIPAPIPAPISGPAAPAVGPAAPPNLTRLVIVLGLLIALGPLTIDTYLPALPSISTDLLASSTAVQLTLTGTLIGLSLGQLVIGPISDALGRRRPLIAGVAVHVLASLLCAVAPNVAVLGALRVLQGVAVAAATVVAMAIVRDVASGTAAATLLSRLMLVMGVAPVLAPTLGSQVLRFTPWRGIFVALAGLGVVLLVLASVALRETLPVEQRQRGGMAGAIRGYGRLLHDRVFVGLVLVAGLSMAALFCYVAGSPFVYQEQFGLSEQQFGFAFGLGSISLIGATQLNAWLLRRFEPGQILPVAVAAGALSGLVLLGVALSGTGGLIALMIPMWGVLGAAGLAFPNAPALALSRHGDNAGAAAAMLGAVQFGLGALTPPLVGLLGGDAVAMALGVLASMALSLTVLVLVVRPRQVFARQPLGRPQVAPAPARAEAGLEPCVNC